MLNQLMQVTHLNLINLNGKKLFINNSFNSFKKTISVDGDKSISIKHCCLDLKLLGKRL